MAALQPHRHRSLDQHLRPAHYLLCDVDGRYRLLGVEAKPPADQSAAGTQSSRHCRRHCSVRLRILAGFQIPAQRTLYMLSVAAIGLWLGRPGTASIVWLWALAVVLAWDPWASLTPGFWLSFGAVGLLLYIGVGRVGTMPAWREAVHAQAAITFGLIPLMLFLFQQISIVSPLANAVAIPVVTFIVVPLTL